jgi:hypothetical protein
MVCMSLVFRDIVDSLRASGNTATYQVAAREARSPVGHHHFRIEEQGGAHTRPTPRGMMADFLIGIAPRMV